MSTWTRQPQEQEGDYFFNGKFLVTARVNAELSLAEIMDIHRDVLAFAQQEDGIDYLQVYLHPDGRKLWFMDQLSKSMIESGEFAAEHHYCTLMYPEER